MTEYENQENIENAANYSQRRSHNQPVPPPTVIERVKVDKVYEECKQVDVNEIEIPLENSEIMNEDIMDVECVDVKLLKKKCEIPTNGLVRLWIKYKITYLLNNQQKTKVVDFEKTVRLPRAGEEGLEPQCEVFLECLDAFIIDNTIVLCIGKLLLFKLFAHVQLLIPAFGFAPQPEECPEVLEECPEFQPEWPPYPPQT